MLPPLQTRRSPVGGGGSAKRAGGIHNSTLKMVTLQFLFTCQLFVKLYKLKVENSTSTYFKGYFLFVTAYLRKFGANISSSTYNNTGLLKLTFEIWKNGQSH